MLHHFCEGTLFNVFLLPLIQVLATLGKTLFNVFGFGALKVRDRIQTIPFTLIPKASRALSTVGPYSGCLI